MPVTINFVDERKSIKIAVSPEAHAAVKAFAKQYDMSEQAVASRIYLWFVEQDDIFQRAVMGMLDGLEVDAAHEFMRRMATEKKERPIDESPDRAMATILRPREIARSESRRGRQ